MKQFRYHAIDKYGAQYSNTIQATSVADAADRLRSAEVNLIAVELDGPGPPGYESARERPRTRPSLHEPASQRPDAAPRDIKIPLSHNAGGFVLLFIGSIFALAGFAAAVLGVALLVDDKTEPATAVLALAGGFLPVGLGMVAYVVSWRSKRWRTYREGEVVMATIEKSDYNRHVRVNGRNPFQLVWTFDIDGTPYRGKRSTFDKRTTAFVPGEKMWAIYRPSAPKHSVEWPPLG